MRHRNRQLTRQYVCTNTPYETDVRWWSETLGPYKATPAGAHVKAIEMYAITVSLCMQIWMYISVHVNTESVLPVTALVVVGRLSRSSFTAVTPIPYSVPGLRPAQQHQIKTLWSSIMFCWCKSTEVSLNEWWGSHAVKWPAVWTNGSSAYGKHKNTLTGLTA